jgi:hypothetical protein
MPPPVKKPLVFGKEEKKSPLAKYLPWAFIAIAVIAIGVMIAKNPKQKALNCHSSSGASASLTSFGTCTED